MYNKISSPIRLSGGAFYRVVANRIVINIYQGCELGHVGSLPYFCYHKQSRCSILHHPANKKNFYSEGKICLKCSRFREVVGSRQISGEVMLADMGNLKKIILKYGDGIVDCFSIAKESIMGMDWSGETSARVIRTVELLFADKETGSG